MIKECKKVIKRLKNKAYYLNSLMNICSKHKPCKCCSSNKISERKDLIDTNIRIEVLEKALKSLKDNERRRKIFFMKGFLD